MVQEPLIVVKVDTSESAVPVWEVEFQVKLPPIVAGGVGAVVVIPVMFTFDPAA